MLKIWAISPTSKHQLFSKMKYFKVLVFSFVFISCTNDISENAKYVNPFIGTGAHGHTFPGATSPFGMVQ